MNCNNQCKVCPRLIVSTSVTIVAVDGVDTLVVDIPAGMYFDCAKYCIIIAQTVPTEATISMPVAISIGGVTTTLYPWINSNCTPVTACGISSRVRYPVTVFTSATSGVFRSTRYICCYPTQNLAAIPAPDTTVTPGG